MTHTEKKLMHFTGRIITAAFFTIGLCTSAIAQQKYPEKPITLVVGFAAGTSTDIVARIVADGLSARLPQPVIVENMPGANGVRAAIKVADAKPDGYTILVTNTSAMTLNPLLHKNIGYDPLQDYEPIGTAVATAALLLVNPEGDKTSGVATLEDLFKVGQVPPGLSYPSHGVGNLWHLAGAELGHVGKFEALHVPYSSTLMRATLLGKEVDFAFDTLAAVPTVQAGQLRALAVATKQRRRELPDVPTFEELGFPSLTYSLWTGFMAPVGTPKDIVSQLQQRIAEVTQDSGLRDKLMMHGDILTLSPAELSDAIATGLEQNATAMKRANVTAM